MKSLTHKNTMLIAGHRGDSYNYYENTMEAFRAAVESGADMIETDVRLSKDGKLVLMHDAKVDRTTDGSGPVSEKTFEELRGLNAGGKKHFLQIPTLEELLVYLHEKQILLNLEIKEYYSEENVERCHQCIDLCVELIEKYGYADKMVFNSFDAHVLEYIEEQYGGKYLLHGFYPYTNMKNITRNPDEYLYCACIFEDRNTAHYQYLIERGIEPWIGAGVTRKGHLQECYTLGARLITTNFPGDCMQKLKAIGARHD